MQFATHVANLTYEQIPDEVTAKAKLILRDGVGNEIAASAISEPANKHDRAGEGMGRRAAEHDHRPRAEGATPRMPRSSTR